LPGERTVFFIRDQQRPKAHTHPKNGYMENGGSNRGINRDYGQGATNHERNRRTRAAKVTGGKCDGQDIRPRTQRKGERSTDVSIITEGVGVSRENRRDNGRGQVECADAHEGDRIPS